VTTINRFQRMLRWYPKNWRTRYGDEMIALLEDSYSTGEVPLQARFAMAKNGIAERTREAGLISDSDSPIDRMRAGSLLILCGWAFFVVAGSMFAKFADGWRPATPLADRWLPNDGYHAVVWGSVAGLVLVVSAALIVLPALVRLVREGGWVSIRRPVLRVVLVGAVAVAMTGALVIWAHHLSNHDRNGGLVSYGLFFVVWGLATVGAIATSTAGAISVTRQLRLEQRTLTALSRLAIALAAIMAVTLVGTIIWWATEAASAPSVMSNGIGNGIPWSSNTLPPTLVLAEVFMLVGMAISALGAVQIVRGFRSRSTSITPGTVTH
jgi:hypothetical protein